MGNSQLDELTLGSLCIYLFWGVLLLPTQGLSKRFLFIFGKGKTTSRNWYELLPNQPQMVIFCSIPIPKLQFLEDKLLLAHLPPSSSLSLYSGINVPQEGRFVLNPNLSVAGEGFGTSEDVIAKESCSSLNSSLN